MSCSLHCAFAEVAAQQRAQVTKHRLAADNKDPGIHYRVESVKAESPQVLLVSTKWMNGVDETCNLKQEKRARLDSVFAIYCSTSPNHIKLQATQKSLTLDLFASKQIMNRFHDYNLLLVLRLLFTF